MTFLVENVTDEPVPSGWAAWLEKACRACLAMEGLSQDVEISLSYTADEGIRLLNSRYRGKNYPTDVLSFPFLPPFTCPDAVGQAAVGEETALGDIVLNLDAVRRQAREYGHSEVREVCFLTVHSLLHLIGYDHEDEDEEREMNGKQRLVLDGVGLERV